MKEEQQRTKTHVNQWHPAFCSAIRVDLRENWDDLEIQDEFHLTDKPLQIDCVIVKKQKNVIVKSSIGKIFRTHNIIEYKSPDDQLNMQTYYKCMAYAYLYMVSPRQEKTLKENEITITMMRDRYPKQLFDKLKKNGIIINEVESGIYQLETTGAILIQVIVTSQLAKKEHIHLKALTNHISKETFEEYIKDFGVRTEKEKELLDIALQTITQSNHERIEDWKKGGTIYV